MDPLAFAKKLSTKETVEPQLDRWAVRYLEQTAAQTLHAARFVDEADSETKQQYLEVVAQVLSALPDDIDIEVSKDLLDTLIKLSDEDLRNLVRKKVVTAAGLSLAK